MEYRTTTVRAADPVLLPYCRAESEAESQRHLERLLREQAAPVITGILRHRCRVSLDRPGAWETPAEQAARDVYSDALTKIVARLHDCRQDPRRLAISDFRAYVAVTTYRACDTQHRETHPARHALRARLRYALTQTEGFACWTAAPPPAAADGSRSGAGRLVCGLTRWRDEARPTAPAWRRGHVRSLGPTLVRHWQNGADPSMRALLSALFAAADAPLPFDDVLGIVAAGGDASACAELAPVTAEGVLETVRDASANVEASAERCQYLRRLWEEIGALPLPQRRALLLNLSHPAQGRGVLPLLLHCRIATPAQVAATLEMETPALAALWKRLPLEDSEIASLLGITRQQVINLRMTARKRLARRMARFDA